MILRKYKVNRIYLLVQLETSKFGGKLAGIKLPNGDLAIQRTCRKLGDIVTRASIGTHLTREKKKTPSQMALHNLISTNLHDGVLVRSRQIGILISLTTGIH